MSDFSEAYTRPPFTNEEVFRALPLFVPAAALEAVKAEFPGRPDEPFQGHITSEVLLVLSSFSEELATRVAAYAPELAQRVEQVRSDPEGYVRTLMDDRPW